MIDDIHELGLRWGRDMRKLPNGWPPMGMLGKIHEFGPTGAAIKGNGDYVPIRDMPEEVREFHLVWENDLSKKYKRAVYVFYSSLASFHAKADELGISKSVMYERIDRAHFLIQGRLRNRFG